jgi:hypothetical protein
MTGTSFQEGDVLWIDPEVYAVPEMPDGFAFLVQDLLGWGDPGHAVWTRGVLIERRGTVARPLTLCVPTNQPRAVPTTPARAHTPPARIGGAATVRHASHRTSDPGLIGPPPGYRRRQI